MYRLITCLVIAFFAISSLAAMAQEQQPVASEQSAEERVVALERDLEEERARSRDSERARQLAEARAELTDAAQGRFENWIGFYGILIALLVAGAGFISWRAATRAAKEEIRAFKTRAEEIIEDIELHRDTAKTAAKKLTETAAKAVKELPGKTKSEPLAESDRISIDNATEIAEVTDPGKRTATDFRLLLRRAEREEDWSEYVRLAEGMAYLHSDNASDLAYALFARAFGNYELGNFEQAAHQYKQYWERCPDDKPEIRVIALHNWGSALIGQARISEKDKAERLLLRACEKFEQALAIKPEDHETLCNWGIALAERAPRKVGVDADELWSQAYEKYKQALAIKADHYDALNSWGSALDEQARRKEGAEADRLWSQAYERYEQALAIKPDLHEALNNWGSALDEQARRREGEEADLLWQRAFEKYEQALAIKGDCYEALNNWSIAIIWQAHRKKGDDRERLLNEAEEKLHKVEAMAKGHGAYDLACIAGLRGDADTAVRWLREGKAQNQNFPDCAHVREDKDFDSIRDTEAFQAALKDIGC